MRSAKGNIFSRLLGVSGVKEDYKSQFEEIEEKYQTLFEYSGTGMILIDRDMTIVAANRKASEITGYSFDEVLGKLPFSYFLKTEEERNMVLSFYAQRLQDGDNAAPIQYECTIKHKSGEDRRVWVTISSIPGTNKIHGSFFDITELYNAHQIIADNEKRFRETIELMPAVYCEFDTEMNYTYINSEGYRLFETNPEEIKSGKYTFWSFFPQEEMEHLKRVLRERIESEDHTPQEYKMLSAKGNVLYCLVVSSKIMKNGEYAGLRTSLFNVTEKKEFELELQRQELQLRSIFDTSPIGIAITGKDGYIHKVNKSFTKLFNLQGDTSGINLLTGLALSLDEIDEDGTTIEPNKCFRIVCRESGVEYIPFEGLFYRWSIIAMGEEILFQVSDITTEREKQQRLLEKVEGEVQELRSRLENKPGNIIGESSVMKQLFNTLPDIAAMPVTLLINGESGTGKELLAKTIHDLSPRCDKPFVAINCGALPDNLLEAELFGYKAGAFTDAKNDRAGRFLAADGGTLFLDEIGEISPTMQVKLLRVLQERTIEPLGSDKSIPIDVRIISATHRDLQKEVKEGRFRQDLYYRIHVVQLQLPSLKERPTDIPLLVNHFLQQFNERYGKSITGVSQKVMDKLLQYGFPGNIRELQNIVEHAFLFCHSGQIEINHLPAEFAELSGDIAHGLDLLEAVKSLDELEEIYLKHILKKNNGNRKKSAEMLGMHTATLFRKMKKHGLMD